MSLTYGCVFLPQNTTELHRIPQNTIELAQKDDTKQSRLESTTEITPQNNHVKVLHYFVDDNE